MATPDAPPQQTAEQSTGTGSGPAVSLDAVRLYAWYGNRLAVQNVSLPFRPRHVTAIIGPSGCGKSTLVRCLNRMHEVVRGTRVAGQVLLDGENIYGWDVDPVHVRRLIGMVFQKPNPFPMMSIYENVVAGLKLWKRQSRDTLDDVVEQRLRQVGLWDEVKDKLGASGASLSGGQQQRLCIARTIAVEPQIVLMDEPCSALDPLATYRVEELITELKKDFTIVIVTHNMQQASRVADTTAFMLSSNGGPGELVEEGETQRLFTSPRDKRTEDYITGRFG